MLRDLRRRQDALPLEGASLGVCQPQARGNLGRYRLQHRVHRGGRDEWHAGGALFHDRAANDEGIGPETDQDIASVHLALRHAWFDQVGEFFVVRDRDRTTRIEHNHRAWYGIVSLGAGPWRPYFGAESMRMESGDAYYAGLPNMDRATAGLRYDINAFNVVKLEFRNGTSDGIRTHEMLLQTAFTF